MTPAASASLLDDTTSNSIVDTTNTFKMVAAMVIWIIALVGGMGPLILASSKREINKTLTSVLNMMAAGVFMAGALVHLLPDAANSPALECWLCTPAQRASHKENGDDDETFPWAYFFCGAGFLAILFLETVGHHTMQYSFAPASQERSSSSPSEHTSLLPVSTAITGDPSSSSSSSSSSGCRRGFYCSKGRSLCSSGDTAAHAHVDPLLHSDKISVTSMLVLLALSFHSIMEGIGLGAQFDCAWDILIAILAHKGLAAFALGLELQSHQANPTRIACSMLFFSFMTPLGIFLGWLTTVGVKNGETDSASSAICTALAAGTFLFVSTMEVIPNEMKSRESRGIKILALVSGYCLFGILALWT